MIGIGGTFQALVHISIILTFRLCHEAQLNIGIPMSVWTVSPFFISLLEWIFHGKSLTISSLFGMFLVMICVIAVSLSDLTKPKDEIDIVDIAATKPIYVAVLASFLVPTFVTGFTLWIKYATSRVRLVSYHFTMAYWAIVSIVM